MLNDMKDRVGAGIAAALAIAGTLFLNEFIPRSGSLRNLNDRPKPTLADNKDPFSGAKLPSNHRKGESKTGAQQEHEQVRMSRSGSY